MRYEKITLLICVLLLCCNLVFAAGSFLETVSGADKAGMGGEARLSDLDRATSAARDRLNTWREQQSYHFDLTKLMNSVYSAVSKPSVSWTTAVQLPPTPASLARATLPVLAQAIYKYFGIALTSSDTLQYFSSTAALANWTQQQALRFYELLYKLPKFFTQATKKLARVVSYRGITNVLGYVYSFVPTAHICNSAVRSVALFQETIVHEMTHCFQFSNMKVMNQWVTSFWKDNKPIKSSPTTYGNTNAYEDFAESVRLYVANGQQLKAYDSSRYEFIKKFVMQGREF